MLSQYPKKTVTLHVRCTVSERDAIITRATRAGKSVSDYVRGAAMHYAQPGTPTQHAAQTMNSAASKFLSSSDGRGGA